MNRSNDERHHHDLVPRQSSLIETIRQGNSGDFKCFQNANDEEIRQRDEDGSTLLHALLEISHKLTETNLADGVRLLLARGLRIDSRDAWGRNALHIAAKCRAPEEALTELLAQNSSHVNTKDDESHTPLHLLLLGDDPVNPKCLQLLLQSGGNLESQINAQNDVRPLYLVCERQDAASLLAVVRQECPDVVARHKLQLLNYVTTNGTSNALKALLMTEFNDDSREMKLMDHLLLEAAASTCEATEKAEVLVSYGADLNRLPSLGGCTVFHVAANKGLPALIQLAVNRGMSPNICDDDGNTPIHYAAESGIGGVDCIRVLVSTGAEINAQNKMGRTAMFQAVASGNVTAAVELVKYGSNLPNVYIAREYGPKQLGILADIRVVKSSQNPLLMALRIGGFFTKCAQVNVGYNEQYNLWAQNMETVAREMLDFNESDGRSELLNNTIIFTAVENKQKLFLADGVVQNHLRRVWHGPVQRHGLQFIQYYFTLLLYHLFKIVVFPVLLLLYYLPKYKRQASYYGSKFLYSTPPSVRYGVDALCYMGFVITVVFESVNDTGRRSKSQLDNVEYIVLIYTLGYALHETRQIKRNTLKTYFSSWTNLIDILVLLVFMTYFTLRFIDFSSRGLHQSQRELDMQRAGALLFALATLVVCLRVLDYLKAFPGIGPIQASFRQITQDTVSFLIIIVVFGLAFATSISEVYTAGRYSERYQKVLDDCTNDYLDTKMTAQNSSGPPPTVEADYDNDAFYDYVFECVEIRYTNGRAERSVPESVDGVAACLVSLVWATFGMKSPEDFESKHKPETIIGKFLLGLWLLMSVVVLVNMLIAIITTSFQSVQNNADLEYKFARASVIREKDTFPTVPPPLNIPYVIARMITYLILCDCFKPGKISTEDKYELTCSSPQAAKMILNYINSEEKKHGIQNATKNDVNHLEQKLDIMMEQMAQREEENGRIVKNFDKPSPVLMPPSVVRPRTASGEDMTALSTASLKMLTDIKILFENTMTRIDSRMQQMESGLKRLESRVYQDAANLHPDHI